MIFIKERFDSLNLNWSGRPRRLEKAAKRSTWQASFSSSPDRRRLNCVFKFLSFDCFLVGVFQTHRMFLHSLYQRMLTGQVYVSSPDSALSRYSWTDMCNLVSEQVSAQLSELKRANERVSTLEPSDLLVSR